MTDELARATAEARLAAIDDAAGADLQWGRVAARVRRQVRKIARRTRMVRAFSPTGSYLVADDVLARFLGLALARAGGCTVTSITFHGTGEECTGVSLQIVAPYGSDVRAAAERMRVVSLEIVNAMLGSGHAGFGDTGVDVAVVDIAEPA